MEDFELVFPTMDYKEEALAMLEEVKIADKGQSWQFAGMTDFDKCSSYEEWLEKLKDELNKETVPKGRVPASTYFLVRKNDNIIIGMVNIRHELPISKYAGHIGYTIRPSERRKGYATIQLSLALKKASKLGIDKALLTCNIKNIGSAKVIEKCYGQFESTILDENKGITKKRYWIDTKLFL